MENEFSRFLKQFYDSYKSIPEFENITHQDLVSIWQNFLGRVNYRTVKYLYEELQSNEYRRAEVLKFLREEDLRERMRITNSLNQHEESDGVVKDESDMEFANQELLNKYQNESRNVRTIIISEEQFKTLLKLN